MIDMIDNAIDLFGRQFASPVRCFLHFTENGAAGTAPEQPTPFRTVELTQLDILSAWLLKVWTM